MSFLQLAWRALLRDGRAGSLNLLFLAVTLAVAAVSAVGFFADRLQSGLQRDAAQLLGGDVVLVSDQPAPTRFLSQAQMYRLQSSTNQTLATMARSSEKQGANAHLVALKAVSAGYPLRGQLRIGLDSSSSSDSNPNLNPNPNVVNLNASSNPDFVADEATNEIPQVGEVWVESSLLSALNLQINDVLLLGDASFQISRVLTQEPDRGSGFLSFSPRVLMNQMDLSKTGLVQEASRITYRLALSGESQQDVVAFTDWVNGELKKNPVRGLRVESLESGRPEMRQTLDRAENFLNLVALLATLLSAVAISLASRRFAENHLDSCALLRVLGLSQRQIAWSYATQFIAVGLSASLIGVTLGYITHYLFVSLLSNLIATQLPSAGFLPVILGLGLGLTLLTAFGLPPVLQLAKVPALRVIRRELGSLQTVSLSTFLLGLTGFIALLLFMSRDLVLGLWTVGGFFVAAILLAVLSFLAMLLLRWAVNEHTSPRWLILATRQISSRPVDFMVQISSLALGLLALVLLILLRTDLVQSWQTATPKDAPNRFVINIQPDQATDFQDALKQAHIQTYDFFPMIRGRLVRINEREVNLDDFQEDRAKRLLDREFNLSTTEVLPSHNQIIKGKWTAKEEKTISVEEGIAKTLKLKLGDTLHFDVAGELFDAQITSIRQVDWGSMRANFFVLFPVAELPNVPLTYLSAFKAPAQGSFMRIDESKTIANNVDPSKAMLSLDNQLVKQFPNLTVIDLSNTLRQVQKLLTQVTKAVEYLFGFTLIAGLVVLFASISASREERAHSFAILRALGASSVLLRQIQRAELLGVGLLAGFLASVMACLISWGLARYVFEFNWQLSFLPIVLGSLSGAMLAWLAGWLSLRGLLIRPVLQTLRESN